MTRHDITASPLQLKPGVNRLGRSPGNDIQINSSKVSSFHCELTLSGHRIRVKDLDSTNGTFLNGLLVDEADWEHGQSLHLADVLIELVTPALPSGAKAKHYLSNPILGEGLMPCHQHPELAAKLKCRKCDTHFCLACGHRLELNSTEVLYFCTECPGQCENLGLPSADHGTALIVNGAL